MIRDYGILRYPPKLHDSMATIPAIMLPIIIQGEPWTTLGFQYTETGGIGETIVEDALRIAERYNTAMAAIVSLEKPEFYRIMLGKAMKTIGQLEARIDELIILPEP